ncbi:retinal short-chain dehydrogenase reductase [Vararia minispora EC-137]|uniref:Retinal short-chain dehydrogenase reductase n=1 Tax=Vararia minispora EC-137 TaxID=1314806 RepID=A0ACB8QY29_9AGAM|nr:retinal short-chain dehydrogenase reductase [Vararia minispora EC-137]
MSSPQDSYVGPVFDTFDVDLVIKVLKHTVFSPFFIGLIPTLFIFQGRKLDSSEVVVTSVWLALISTFWSVQWISLLYRNQGSLVFRPPSLDWGEQIVLITGGSSGIGELIANTLAVRNVCVVVLDVKPMLTENYNITYYKCDVSKWDEVEAVSKKVVEEIGHPTIVINNAGVVQGKLLLDLEPKEVEQTFGVNTISHFWTLKAFLPEMIKQKSGHIVTMSSLLGMVGVAQTADYGASKAALVSLHETLRYELDSRYKAYGVRTTLVCPGHVLTPMFATLNLGTNWIRKFLMPALPPHDVAKAVIAALDSQFSQTIYLPFFANLAPYLPLLPSFARDFIQWASGADQAMLTFKKPSGGHKQA